MWIALNTGFLSVVTAVPSMLPKAEKKRLKGEGRPLCVRARKAEHLQALFPGRKVYQWKARDYPARIFIGAAALAEFMAQQVLNVDYGNFKSSVRDNELHDAYMGVWSVMNGYQHGRYKRGQWTPQGGYGSGERFANRANYGLPFNEQVADDLDDDIPEFEVCETPGCTDLNPCLNCIVAAMGGDPGPEDEDRYGAFDDRDDEGATSPLRVPPK
jgi:hypothetical protein